MSESLVPGPTLEQFVQSLTSATQNMLLNHLEAMKMFDAKHVDKCCREFAAAYARENTNSTGPK